MYLNPSAEYLRVLHTHHRIHVEVYILDNSRRFLSNASSRLVDGTVDMDATASVSRSGKVSLLDPHHDLSIDPHGAQFGSQYYNRMIHILYGVASFENPSVVHKVPIFTGPIVKAEREGVLLNLEFKGMEILAQEGVLNDYTWPAGWPRSAIIMNGLFITTGEPHFRDWSGGTQVIRSNWSVESGDNLWEEFKHLADSMAMNLYYDGNGVCNIKPKSGAVTFGLDSTWLTEDPNYSFDLDNIHNVVRVEGAAGPVAPGEEEIRMKYEAWPPPQHPFSPQSLARNGIPRIMPILIGDDSLKDFNDIADTAWNNLVANLTYITEATAVSVVVPFLEEFDVVNINHPKLYANTPLMKWTIPLVGDAEMSLNFFSTTSSGYISKSNFVSNANNWGRFELTKHGPSGGFNTMFHNGGKGRGGGKKYTDPGGIGKSRGKKKKKNRKKKKRK